MKTLSLTGILVLLSGLICTNVNAKIWRVNNTPGITADFTAVTTAITSATAGDTIYVEGSTINYSSSTTSKKLTFFGPGYYLSENPNTQASLTPATIDGLTFNNGSAGSLASGLTIGNLYLNESNITIKRNRMNYYAINISSNASNILIIQNHIDCNYNSASYAGVYISTASSGIIIENNYIEGNTSNAIYISPTASSITISNNVINGNINATNCSFYNNILTAGTITASSCIFENNIGNATQFPVGMGNQQNVTMATVFVGAGSADGQWQLASLSPALTAGVGGIDCGMFGGPNPYILSGIPNIPSIYYLRVPSSGSATSGLAVTIKVKTNK